MTLLTWECVQVNGGMGKKCIDCSEKGVEEGEKERLQREERLRVPEEGSVKEWEKKRGIGCWGEYVRRNKRRPSHHLLYS